MQLQRCLGTYDLLLKSNQIQKVCSADGNKRVGKSSVKVNPFNG